MESKAILRLLINKYSTASRPEPAECTHVTRPFSRGHLWSSTQRRCPPEPVRSHRSAAMRLVTSLGGDRGTRRPGHFGGVRQVHQKCTIPEEPGVDLPAESLKALVEVEPEVGVEPTT
jgi:hypothetical protein